MLILMWSKTPMQLLTLTAHRAEVESMFTNSANFLQRYRRSQTRHNTR